MVGGTRPGGQRGAPEEGPSEGVGGDERVDFSWSRE